MTDKPDFSKMEHVGTFTRLLFPKEWTVGDKMVCNETFIPKKERRVTKGEILTISKIEFHNNDTEKDEFHFNNENFTLDRYNINWYFREISK